MIFDEEDYIAHYGILRRSGRYPWGSGGDPNNLELETAKSFLDYVALLRKKFGLSEKQIADDFNISTTKLRAVKSIAKNEYKQEQIGTAQRLKDKGYSNVAAAARMGIPESTYRALLAPGVQDKADVLQATAQMLRDEVAAKRFIDVGKGVENHIGVSETRKKTAIALLEEEGYKVHYLKVPQLTTGHDTTMQVLGPPDSTYSEVSTNRNLVQQIAKFSEDGGRIYGSIQPPISIDPKRVGVRYAEDGGTEADGVIYVRPGVEDISLGGSSYAQVRIKVGEDKYLKGMAMYKPDLPEGVDLLFNTNKSDTGNKLDAMKDLESDPSMPFGAMIKRQILVNPGTPDERVTSAMNILSEEGDWAEWSRTLSSQILSKQPPSLAKTQLDMTFENREIELKRINALTNPTVKKKLLEEFAEGADSASVHLRAAAMPKQGQHVLLPIESMSPREVYAPNYLPGEQVVLIRHPHGGTFEIPVLTVNNRQPEAKRLLGQAKDAIGIHSSVAEQLSGADFDGDTVLVISNQGNKKITATSPLAQLKDFDPRSSYPAYEGMKPLTPSNKQNEMGKVSNLITDMTIKQASHAEIARAVKHSMVVIDAEKHNLNYKQSYKDHGIKALQEKYQPKVDGKGGAATIISRAKSPVYAPKEAPRKYKDGGPVDLATGRRVFVPTGELNYRTGKPRLEPKPALERATDAHTLSSGTPIERLYAQHSNKLKALANQARLDAINTPRAQYSKSAKKHYAKEVDSLNGKLNVALRNAPLERQAQLLGNIMLKAKRESNPTMDNERESKVRNQTLTEARIRTGAGKKRIEITPREWDAIQAGALSDSKVGAILKNADMDKVRDLATPKKAILMTSTKTKRAQSMLSSGHTRAEVAAQLGVSLTTLDTALNA